MYTTPIFAYYESFDRKKLQIEEQIHTINYDPSSNTILIYIEKLLLMIIISPLSSLLLYIYVIETCIIAQEEKVNILLIDNENE
jgi:hypothetical protein